MFLIRFFTRLAWLTMLLFAGTAAVMVAVVVIATDGLGSADLVNLPVVDTPQTTPGTTPQVEPPPASLNETVERRPIFETVPLPSEISTEAPVIGTNLGLTALLAILFGILSTMLNNLLRQKEERLQAWLSLLGLGWVWRLFKAGGGQSVHKGCLGLPIVVLVFALYGIVFAFVEQGFDLFTAVDIQLAIVMAMCGAMVSLTGDFTQRQVARIWRKTTSYAIYPANLTIALFTTVISRVFSIVPGLLFGVPSGIDVEDMEREPRFRHVVLIVMTVIVLLGVGAAGWGIVALLDAAGDRELDAQALEFSGPLFALGQTVGFALLVLAVQTAFFEMAPLGLTMGAQLFRWNVLVWVIFFSATTFSFLHVLLNPRTEYLDAFEQAGVSVLVTMVVILTAVTALLWLFLTYVEPPGSSRPSGGNSGESYRPSQPPPDPFQTEPSYPSYEPKTRPHMPTPNIDVPPPPVRRPPSGR